VRLSTRSRYGMRLLLDMAWHYGRGPIQLAVIAKRQGIPLKYLEQIVIPLKKAHYVQSVRGPRGGHMLAKSPSEINVGEIVFLLERKAQLVECVNNPEVCERSSTCVTRTLWKETTEAICEKLNSISLSDIMERSPTELDL